MSISDLLIGFFIVVGSMAAGALGYERWLNHVVSARKKMARNHALRRKPLITRDEQQVWRWLEEVFPEHQIAVKTPLTGFVEPNHVGGDAHWQALLGSLNFACAVMDRRGTVFGCVDVLGRGEMAGRMHAFKRDLLGRAGIPYWIVENQRRPAPEALRARFTEEPRTKPESPELLAQARQAALTAQTPINPTALEQPMLSRVSSHAVNLTQTGVTPVHLKSSLGLPAVARALAARLGAAHHVSSPRKPLGFPPTSSSVP